MDIFLFILGGFLGGIAGAMGFGGGSIMIPFLTIFMGVSQIMAQGYNLLAFIPMSVVALFFHLKNRLVYKNKKILLILLPSVITSIASSFLSQYISSEILKKIYGLSILVLALYELYIFIIKCNKENS